MTGCRWLCVVWVGIGLCLAVEPVLAQGDQVSEAYTAIDPPRDVVYETASERVRAMVFAFDQEHFYVGDPEDSPEAVAWSGFTPRAANRILERVVDSRDARGWLNAGLVLQDLEWAQGVAGRPQNPSEAALARAERLDPELNDAVEQARLAQAEREPPPVAAAAAVSPDPAGETDLGEAAWPTLSPEQHDAFLAQYQAWFKANLDAIGFEHQTYPSDNFVLYTDLPPTSARATSALLEQMYDRLLEMFLLPDDTRVYAGKCLILITARGEDYEAFARQTGNPEVQHSLGLCFQRSDGFVYMTCRSTADELDYLHTIVHENVHGFLFRYRSRYLIPNWINEGLAEWIAHDLVDSGRTPDRQHNAHQWMRAGRPLGTFFDDRNIEAWAYGLAYGLTELMVQGEQPRYRDFIFAIKDGTPWREALQTHFGVDEAGLMSLYRRAHRLPEPSR